MGAMAEAMVQYAQPLIDETDGSFEEVNKALSLSQCCFMLAQLPEASREQLLIEIKRSMEMDDVEFAGFRSSVVAPMIDRYDAMFSRMPTVNLMKIREPMMVASVEKYPGADRYGPCPCESGRKYKFCCGKKGP